MMMNYKKVAGAGIAAVTLSLMASSAMAAFSNTTTVNANAPVFATQAITAAGAVTIPNATVVYTTDITGVAANVGTGAYTIVFTLPAGVTFTSAPTIAVSGATGTATLSAGGSGSNSATYIVNITTGAAAPILTFSSFAITGATALSTAKAVGTFLITEQITTTAVTGIGVQSAPLGGSLALSSNAGSIASAAGAAGTLSVDITGSSGTKFLSSVPANQGAPTVGDDGTLAFTLAATVKADGVTAFTFTSPTLTETLTGNTGGLTGAYLLPGAANCAATLGGNAGGQTGVIAAGGNTITFSAVPSTSGTLREVCLYGGGTLLSANPNGFAVSAVIDTTTVTAFTLPYSYNGIAAKYAYATNATQYYQQYIRITNTGVAPIAVTAQVITDAGLSTLATVETALAAGASDLVPFSTIATNAGNAASANGRYSVTLFGPATTSFENLLVNPGGVVTEFNRQFTVQ